MTEAITLIFDCQEGVFLMGRTGLCLLRLLTLIVTKGSRDVQAALGNELEAQ